MYTEASEQFNTAIRGDGRRFRARLSNGTDYIDSGFSSIKTYGGSNGAETITIGSTISQRIEVELAAQPVELSGKEWKLEIGLLTDDAKEIYEYVPMGLFTPEKPRTDNGKTTFTAYDRMMKLSGLYTCAMPDTDTISILNDISDETGVPIDTSGLQRLPIQAPEGYTYREVLMYIAQMYGKFANVNRDGVIQFHWWMEISGYELTPADTRGFTHEEKPFILGHIICSTGQDEEGETAGISAGTGLQGIDISNPFMTQDRLEHIYNEMKNFSYTVSEVNVPMGDIRLDPWDMITVKDREGNAYKIPLMTLEFSYDGGLSSVISCVGYSEEETQTDYKGPMQTFQERIQAAVAEIGILTADKASIDDLEALRIRVDKITGTEITVEYLEAHYVTAGYLNANYTSTERLEAEYVSTEHLEANYAKLKDIEAEYIKTTAADIQYARLDKANITDGWITTAMIGEGVVGTVQIADGSITDAKIVSLTANKLAAGTIDAAKIEVINLDCANLTVGTINGQQIAAGAVDLSKLNKALSETITTTEADVREALRDAKKAHTLADSKNAVFYQTSIPTSEGRKLNDIWFDTDDGNKMYCWDGTTWSEKQFGTNAIANASITNALIADAAIQDAKIANLDAGKLTSGYISSDRISAGSIVAEKIASNAITSAKISAGAVDADKLAANAVTAGKIAANAVTADTIASNAVTSVKISAGAVTTEKINAGAVTADKIVSNAITAAKIAAGAVSTDKLAANAVTAAKIAAGAISTDKLAANAVTAAKIDVSDLFAQNITAKGTISGVTLKSASGEFEGTVTASEININTGINFYIDSNKANKISTQLIRIAQDSYNMGKSYRTLTIGIKDQLTVNSSTFIMDGISIIGTTRAHGNIIVGPDGSGAGADADVCIQKYGWYVGEKLNELNSNKILWSGSGYLMTAGHTATLSQKISEQCTGIVLIFSAYTSSTVQNWGFASYFVPKYIIGSNTRGFAIPLTEVNSSGALQGAKYLYISDDKITGSDNNTKGNNGRFVLRYVLGV